MGTSDSDSLAVTLSLGTLPEAVSCCNMSGFLSSRNIPKQASCLLVFCNVEDVRRCRVDSCLRAADIGQELGDWHLWSLLIGKKYTFLEICGISEVGKVFWGSE